MVHIYPCRGDKRFHLPHVVKLLFCKISLSVIHHRRVESFGSIYHICLVHLSGLPLLYHPHFLLKISTTIYYRLLSDIPVYKCPTDFLTPAPCDASTLVTFDEVGEEDVLAHIRRLEFHKATGPDSIPSQFIKRLQKFLIWPISITINRSLDTAVVPNVWKQANVVRIPKNVDHSKVCHFHPISILPILSKLHERIVQDQVKLHLQTHNLLCDC